MISDFSMTLQLTLNNEAVIALCRNLLPEFTWKIGNSEY